MTSDLDAFLGRPPISAAPAERESKPTNWPKAEERLRPLLDAWDDEMMYPRWTAVERKWILAGARDFAELTTDPQVLREAMSRMRSTGLTLKTPRSCITIGRQVLDARQSFVGRLDDDPVAEEDPLVPCRKCGKLVRPERMDDDCKGH